MPTMLSGRVAVVDSWDSSLLKIILKSIFSSTQYPNLEGQGREDWETFFLRVLLGSTKVDSAIHSSEVDQMSTRNFWELRGKK